MMSVCTGETLQAGTFMPLYEPNTLRHPWGGTSFVNKQNEAMQFFDRAPNVPLMQLGKGACMFVWACIAFVSAAWCLLPSLLLPACLFTSNLTLALAHFHSRLCTFSPPLSPSGFFTFIIIFVLAFAPHPPSYTCSFPPPSSHLPVLILMFTLACPPTLTHVCLPTLKLACSPTLTPACPPTLTLACSPTLPHLVARTQSRLRPNIILTLPMV